MLTLLPFTPSLPCSVGGLVDEIVAVDPTANVLHGAYAGLSRHRRGSAGLSCRRRRCRLVRQRLLHHDRLLSHPVRRRHRG